MLRLLLALLMGGVSTACALAAVGWTLYAHSPAVVWVAQCFAGFGFVAGLACGALHLHLHGRPAPAPAGLAPAQLASLVRATLASASAERQARPGTAADRRPAGATAQALPPPPRSTPAATAAVATSNTSATTSATNSATAPAEATTP